MPRSAAHRNIPPLGARVQLLSVKQLEAILFGEGAFIGQLLEQLLTPITFDFGEQLVNVVINVLFEFLRRKSQLRMHEAVRVRLWGVRDRGLVQRQDTTT